MGLGSLSVGGGGALHAVCMCMCVCADLLMKRELSRGQSESRGPEQTGRGTAARGGPCPSHRSSGHTSTCTHMQSQTRGGH